MTAGRFEKPSSEAPDNSALNVNIFAGASGTGLRRLRHLAETRTASADLRAALARDEPPPGEPLPPRDPWAPSPWAVHEADAEGLSPLEWARRYALDTLDRVARLPNLHARALLRLTGERTGHPVPAVDALRAGVEQDRSVVRWERKLGAAGTPIALACAAGAALAEIQPPATEFSPEGARLVRGAEDEIRAAAEDAAAAAARFYEAQDKMRDRRGLACDAPLPRPPRPWIREERCSARWWTRRLRREALRAQAYYDTALRLCRPGSEYVSNYTLGAWRERRQRQHEWAAGHEVQFEDGTTVPLPTIQYRARRARRAALYTVMKAQEWHAAANGYTAYFITLTLPGEWHAVSAGPRAADGSYPQCRDNPHWTAGHGPRAAWQELQHRWAKLRAQLAKAPALRAYWGISVPEPHQDGTPHLHALLYLPRSHADAAGAECSTAWTLRRILRSVCPGPRAARLEIVRQRRGRRSASPASYVMKYVLKSLDDDTTLAEQGEGGERYRAWASARGIRRMRLIGVHGSLRIWQRLWTSGEDELLPPRAEAARAAMRRSQAAGAVAGDAALTEAERTAARERQAAAAAEALTLIGGLPGGDGRLRLTYEEGETEYGRPTRRPEGIVDPATEETMPLRRQKGVIVPVENGSKNSGVTVAAIGPRGAPAAPPLAADPDDLEAADALEILIRVREGQQVWQTWCEERRKRVAVLRQPSQSTRPRGLLNPNAKLVDRSKPKAA